MRRLNNKGFLLVETLVVTAFIATIFMFIYQNAIPMIGIYKQRFKYDDLDSVYAASLIRDMLIDEYKNGNTALFNGVTATSSVDTLISNDNLTDNGYCGSRFSGKVYCNTLAKRLSVSRVYLIHYDTTTLIQDMENNTIFKAGSDRGIKSYLNYMEHFTADSYTINQYRVVVVRRVHENEQYFTRYANIEVILP